MIVMMHLKKEWYKDYSLVTKDPNTGKEIARDLDDNMHITAANLIKNRRGPKQMFALSSNLNTNVWIQQNGILVPKERKKNDLMW